MLRSDNNKMQLEIDAKIQRIFELEGLYEEK